VGQVDSNSGFSTSTLGELTIGPVSIGTEESTTSNSSDTLVFVGLTPGTSIVSGGVFTPASSGTFGVFVGIGSWGVGGYLSLGGGGTNPIVIVNPEFQEDPQQ
jgi:hypothetical protein